MNGLGIPLEERKKAYMGHTKSDLIAKYNDARQKGDLPTMIALLDIIKAAPAGMQPPASTVEQDIMAAAEPAQPPAGFEGAVGAMENQAPMPQTGLPQMAANGGVMNFDDESGEDVGGNKYASGGPVRMQAGMLATSTAPYDISVAPLEDLFRFAQYGDKDAADEIVRRGAATRQGMGYTYTPMSEAPKPGPGIGPTSPQTTDMFRNKTWQTPPPGAAAPGAAPAPAAPPASGISGLAGRVWDFTKKGIGMIGKGTLLTELLRPTEANVGEEDALKKMRLLQEKGKALSESDRKLAQHFSLQPSMSFTQFQDKFFPTAKDTTGQAPIPSAVSRATTNTNLPAYPQSALDMLKPRTLDEMIRQRKEYEKGLSDKGEITSMKDIEDRLESFRTEAGKRKEEDIAEAKKGFTEDLLWTAALSAPQVLKGRGLAQGVARAAESAMPMIMKAAEKKGSAMREAVRSDRDAKDKFELAKIDMAKANRAEQLGIYDRADTQRQDALKTYASAILDKYKSDAYVQAHLGAYDKMLVGKQFDLAEASLGRLYMSKQFKEASPEMQREMIRMQVQQFFSVKPGGTGGYPPIQNVPNR